MTSEAFWYQSSQPQPGEFRMARYGEEFPRMVLVVAPVEGIEASNIWLVSTEVEYATGTDFLLEPQETRLPVPVIVETDIGFPLWNSQLDDPVGELSDAYTHLLRPMIGADELPTERRGLDLRGPWDSRREWKQREYGQMVNLASDLFSELMASPKMERAFEEVGQEPVHWPAPLDIVPGLKVVVDILGGDAPPLVRWDPESPDAVAVAEHLLVAIYGPSWATAPVDTGHDLARSVRSLALAEERYTLTGLEVWTLDSAVACAELIDGLILDDRWTLLEDILDERLPVAVDVLRSSANAHGIEASEAEILRTHCERRGLSLPSVGPPGGGTARGATSAAEERHQVTQAVPVTPKVAVQGVELEADIVRLRLSRSLPEGTTLWLHVFDRATGDVVAVTEFQPDERAAEAAAQMLQRDEAHGALVLEERHEHVDVVQVLGELLAAAPLRPAAAARFAEAAQRELRGGRTGELLAAVAAALRPERGDAAKPHFMSGADVTPGARLLAAAQAREERIAEIGVGPERPESLSPARWKALLAEFGDWLGGVLEVRSPLAPALQAATPSALRPRAFGRGISVTPIGDRRDAVVLKINAAALGQLAEEPLLVVLQDERGNILAAHEFERVAGTETVEVAVDAAAATAGDIVMILASRPRRAT